MMFCAIWYHLFDSKNVTNTHEGVLLLVTLLHGCFHVFLNCTNGTKSRSVSHLFKVIRRIYAPSKLFGRYPFKNFNWYVWLKQIIMLHFFLRLPSANFNKVFLPHTLPRIKTPRSESFISFISYTLDLLLTSFDAFASKAATSGVS